MNTRMLQVRATQRIIITELETAFALLIVSLLPRQTRVCEDNSHKCNKRHEDLSSLNQSKTSPVYSAALLNDKTYLLRRL